MELIKVDANDKTKRLSGVTFEIRKANDALVDTVTTDKNGRVALDLDARSYYAVEIEAAEGYKLDDTPTPFTVEDGKPTKITITNKKFSGILLHKTDSITGKGISGVTFLLYDSTNKPIEVVPGQSIRYDFSNIANNSTSALTSFYWRDTLPTQAVRLDKIVTGTYNVKGNYKIVYKTNLSGSTYRTLADNVSTQQNKVYAASPAALGLASNECVTEFMCVFGVVPGNFRQVEAPQVYCKVLSGLAGGTQFSNQADVGGMYDKQWIMATDRWVTSVYAKEKSLPRTGY